MSYTRPSVPFLFSLSIYIRVWQIIMAKGCSIKKFPGRKDPPPLKKIWGRGSVEKNKSGGEGVEDIEVINVCPFDLDSRNTQTHTHTDNRCQNYSVTPVADAGCNNATRPQLLDFMVHFSANSSNLGK